jgi:Inosine-uridine nucleoside N-ribohydrolase
MEKIYFIILALSSVSLLSCNTSNESNNAVLKEKIIFDTDMGPDYDDVGAIAVLHALADMGECEILATVSSNSHASIAPTIETFNRYYKKPDIPVGIPDHKIIDFTADNHWNDSVIVKFAPDLKGKSDYPNASDIYRKVLSSQPDKSVTIITVGFMTNLANLLKTKGDTYSPLSGVELVRQKVKKWVAMAGHFPEGREFNVFIDSVSSSYVFDNWPTQILFSGFEIGMSILTGDKLIQSASSGNPLSWAYKYNLATYEKTPVTKRMSWDQTAVLCAVRNPENYFYVCGSGKFTVKPDGYNYWDPDTDAEHYFLVHKYPYGQIADTLENLMIHKFN